MRHQRAIDRKAIVKRLRRECTNAEWLLWQVLRRKRLLGLKVRRQHQIGKWVVDFCCPALHLVIEVDGGIHDDPDQKHRDEQRAYDLMLMGFTILRFTNREVEQFPEYVIARLRSYAEYALIARQTR